MVAQGRMGWGAWARHALVTCVLVFLGCPPAQEATSPDCEDPATIAPSALPPRSGDAPPLVVVPQVGHTSRIGKVAYSPDSTRIVSVAQDVKVWDTRTGMLARTLQLGGDALLTFALHPDGRRIVTGSREGMVTVWDLDSGARVVHVQMPGTDFASQLAISLDGQRVVVGCRSGAFVLRLDNGQILARLETRGQPAHAVSFTNHRALLAFKPTKYMEVWDIEAGRRSYTLQTAAEPARVVFSRDGKRLIMGLHSSETGGYATATRQAFEILLYDAATGAQQQALTGMKRAITDAELSPDGRRLAVCGPDTLFLFDLATSSIVDQIGIYPRSLVSVAYEPHGTEVALGTMPMNSRSPAIVTFTMPTKEARRTYEGTRFIPTAAAFSGDSRHALIGSEDETMALWDTESGAVVKSYAADDDWRLSDVDVADDGRRAIASSPTRVALWDLQTSQVRYLPLGSSWTYDVDITPDGRRIAACGYPNTVRVWDYDSAQPRAVIRGGDATAGLVTATSITPDGNAVLWLFQAQRLRLSHAESGDLMREYVPQSKIDRVTLSKSGRLFVTVGDALTLWSIDNPAPLRVLSVEGRRIRAAAFMPDETRIVTVDGSPKIVVRELATGRILAEHGAVYGGASNVSVAPDGRHVITTSRDGSARLWDLSNGRSMSVVSSKGEWLIYDDDGYFDASRRGGDLVAMSLQGRAFRIDQLAVRFNRPGPLLAGLGRGSGGLWQHLTAQHQRRLRRMGISESSVANAFVGAPEVRITDVSVAGSSAVVSFSATARGGSLARYNVYVNDVPLLGLRGRNTQGTVQNLRETIALTQGVNRIEVSVTDAGEVESLRDLRTVTSDVAQPRDLHVLAFGVSHYKNPRYNLGYAHKDALDLVEVAKAMEGRGFRRVHAHAFVDDSVTVPRLKAAKQLLRNAQPSDVLVVFVAGHGVYSRDDAAQYYYITHEGDLERLRETAAPFSLIEDLVQEVAPRHKLLLIDTCASGDRDPESAAPVTVGAARALKARGLELMSLGPGVPARRSFLFERDRFVYNDLLRRSGAIVFSSSRGSEYSFEDASIENGHFTEEILRALTSSVADSNSDGQVSSDELRKHVSQAVAAATHQQQHPTVDHDNPVVKFGFPVVAAAAPVAMRHDPGSVPASAEVRALVFEPAAAPCVPATRPPPGCNCRSARGSEDAHAAWLWSLVALLAMRRRRPRVEGAEGTTRLASR
jgi:MYXO-CTERM domain-containing protein